MNLASLQTITWSTVTAAVGSALLLAAVGADMRPVDVRPEARPVRSTAPARRADAARARPVIEAVATPTEVTPQR
jgi:hypothetical protein